MAFGRNPKEPGVPRTPTKTTAMRIAGRVALSLALGIVLFLCEVLLTFLPFLPVINFVLFFFVGYVIVRAWPDNAPLMILVAVFLPWALAAHSVWMVGGGLAKGIGVYHLVDLVLIPLAAVCGAAMARHRMQLRKA